MEKLFNNLIDNTCQSKKSKIITLIAENFILINDRARFLRSILSISSITNSTETTSVYFIQVGHMHKDVALLTSKLNFNVLTYHPTINNELCDSIWSDLDSISPKSLIFVNSISTLALSNNVTPQDISSICYKLKFYKNHTVIPIYQGPRAKIQDCCLTKLLPISDTIISVSSCDATSYTCKVCIQSNDSKTLIPEKQVNIEFDCKIENLQFVSTTRSVESLSAEMIEISTKASGDDDEKSTLPFINVQNSDDTQIFYYPNKDDDLDEDDPDDDLCI